MYMRTIHLVPAYFFSIYGILYQQSYAVFKCCLGAYSLCYLVLGLLIVK